MRRGRLVLWGGRRYDFQLGSQRDLRRCETLRLFHSRYEGVLLSIARNLTDAGSTFEPTPEMFERMRRALYANPYPRLSIHRFPEATE